MSLDETSRAIGQLEAKIDGFSKSLEDLHSDVKEIKKTCARRGECGQGGMSKKTLTAVSGAVSAGILAVYEAVKAGVTK